MRTTASRPPRLVLFVLDADSGQPLRWISVHADVVGVELTARGRSASATCTVDALLRDSPAFAAVIRRAVTEAMEMAAMPQNHGTKASNRT